MFINFPLNKSISKFSGVDRTHFKHKLPHNTDFKRLFGRWERCWMGLRPSPFWAAWFYYFAAEFARGNPQDTWNALRWDKVILNLPGSETFNPALPWVMKWDSILGRIAGDIVAFVDNLRISGYDEEMAWQIARPFLSRLQYMGIQDAARKTRPPTRILWIRLFPFTCSMRFGEFTTSLLQTHYLLNKERYKKLIK